MIVSVVALSITGFLSFNYADQILKQRAGDQLLGESTVRGETLILLFESRIDQNNILANDPMIQLLISEMNKIPENELKEIKNENRRDFLIQVQAFQELIGFSIGFEDVKIIGANGKVFFSLGGVTDKDFLENPLFQKGLRESFIEFEPTEAGKRMIVVSPVFADDSRIGDEPIGVIISRMRTAAIDNILLDRSGLGDTGEVYIVSDEFLMLSESRFFENLIFQQKVDTIGVQKCFNEGQEYVGFYSDYRDVPIYGSSYCADDFGVVLLAEIDEAEIEKPIYILQNLIFQTGIAITIGLGIVAFVISKSLSRPLIKLKSAANKIASGDFDVRTNIKTGDEIGEVSQAFDSMAKNLQESHIAINLREEIIKQQEDLLVRFSQTNESSCVGIVDIIQSTVVTADLSDQQTRDFYGIFINSSAAIVKKFGGIVIKNIGDSVLFYFPKIDPSDKAAFKNVLECCLSLGEANPEINKKLVQEGLPGIAYRISVTYGKVSIAKVATSSVDDIFGATVNRCSKINRFAFANTVIIGSDVYENVKTINDYNFKNMNANPTGGTTVFSVYLISRR